ncbi:methyltransferase domain-containing protein [Bermanella marisrubri]|uniref:Methyltransferase domain-containing protein n=1 Tax=Bermanella marisrubri TaxID=207949 RepID=Q1N2Y5_9GAMM|nr:pseudaminic acid biosynthesis-associated methylase [Bermanella marisrubri]EAT12534.1 hypothetical protein RED65_06553 [Oceanobacter sp. RED65] [Bermanella marisrubri]QIZ84908.1 methyltransferase domain-containing protein [Bermanella marisrubri]
MSLSDQESFWKGEFGLGYIDRNKGEKIISSNIHLFSNVFKNIDYIDSIVEFGCNIGLNLLAIDRLMPDVRLTGVDINENALSRVENWGKAKTVLGSVVDLELSDTYDLTFTKGVLIHINPDHLNKVYENLYNYSNRYILVAEYYNPNPVTVPYRGESDKLFKRDFAGEILDIYSDLKLLSYGFCYKRDLLFPQDDITWFLLEKSK